MVFVLLALVRGSWNALKIGWSMAADKNGDLEHLDRMKLTTIYKELEAKTRKLISTQQRIRDELHERSASLHNTNKPVPGPTTEDNSIEYDDNDDDDMSNGMKNNDDEENKERKKNDEDEAESTLDRALPFETEIAADGKDRLKKQAQEMTAQDLTKKNSI